MGSKKKKREEPSGPPGAPEWVVTFTDMISLLVTFFVLMMTFSSLDAYEALSVDSFLDATSGIHKVPPRDSAAKLGPEDVVASANLLRGGSTPHSRPPDELPDDVEEMGQKMTDEHRALDLTDVADGIVMEFGADESFAPGSDEVLPGLARTLTDVARVLEHYPHLVVIEGFTDGSFRSNSTHASPESLSLARARNAALAMLGSSKMSKELIQVSGHGAALPRADNVSPNGRQLNRRIQIRILSLSKARANYYENKRIKEKVG